MNIVIKQSLFFNIKMSQIPVYNDHIYFLSL